jgi:hypothetical protein
MWESGLAGNSGNKSWRGFLSGSVGRTNVRPSHHLHMRGPDGSELLTAASPNDIRLLYRTFLICIITSHPS